MCAFSTVFFSFVPYFENIQFSLLDKLGILSVDICRDLAALEFMESVIKAVSRQLGVLNKVMQIIDARVNFRSRSISRIVEATVLRE